MDNFNLREYLRNNPLLNEIKVKSPGGIIPTSLGKLKEALIQDMMTTAEELEFEEPEEFINTFTQRLNSIPNKYDTFEKIANLYEDIGFEDAEFYFVLKRLFII